MQFPPQGAVAMRDVAEKQSARLTIQAPTLTERLQDERARTAERLANLVQPNVYVKGADYVGTGAAGIDATRLPEAKVVRAHGGQVVLVPLVPDRSSTALAERVRRAAVAP